MNFVPVNDDLYCKIFIDCDISKNELIELILTFLNGKKEFNFSVYNDYLDIDISRNSEVNNQLKLNPDGGFLYFPFFIEVNALENVTLDEFKKNLKNLINFLRQSGFKAIPACKFEEELNDGKPYSEFM